MNVGDSIKNRKGMRYESKQDEGRVVQVEGLAPASPGKATWRWVIKVIANDKNPKTVGRRTTVSENAIATRYEELSH